MENKINLYYLYMYQRRNGFQETVYNFFYAISSWPRLLLEVFVRRNFGERYFSFSGSIALCLLLALYPILKVSAYDLFSSFYSFGYGRGHRFHFWPFMGHYLTWYAFLASFLYMAIQRNEEIKHLPSVFDLARFSLSGGLMHPRLLRLEISGRRLDVRTISILIEPGLFFGIGVILWLMSQSLGPLLVICSIIYSLSYAAAYHMGDNFVMDYLDGIITNQELAKSIIEGREANETRGFSFLGRRPANPEVQRQLVDMLMPHEEIAEAF